ncbi:LacI family transcriptional regulator [Paenibacillus sp. yr247]|uniref:LacI family DNA-binding transcriptional regulator n=1 Tax=Paenibacillus sp. yr247 TaxID=1761880 RepID=UPI000884EEB4|nr:LacI family DNA-binding transcriptional regulator [Paenibacillus sp. yr247]SDP09648.1 LacI family transcriptional regulator [Paenibacillus sp. yr247]
MSVTIYDVAKEAGVSVATVSRVINQLDGVRIATKQRVLKAVEQLQYQYNPAAVALATGKSNVIGLMIPNIRNPFYAEVAEGIYREAMNKGVNVITLNLLDGENSDEGLRLLNQYSVDGLLAMDISKEMLGKVSSLVEHVVLVGNDYLDGRTNCIVTDNFTGIQMMIRHLIELGHERIALLSEKSGYDDVKDRIRAYQYCMEEAGLSSARHVVYANGADIENGEKSGKKWIKEGLHHSAVVVTNDMLAIGLIKALKSAGMSIPRDISVAGFDGTWVSTIVDPTLSSVVQPKYEMGTSAISLIMEKIQSPLSSPRKIVLSPTLQIGGTTAVLNTQN